MKSTASSPLPLLRNSFFLLYIEGNIAFLVILGPPCPGKVELDSKRKYVVFSMTVLGSDKLYNIYRRHTFFILKQSYSKQLPHHGYQSVYLYLTKCLTVWDHEESHLRTNQHTKAPKAEKGGKLHGKLHSPHAAPTQRQNPHVRIHVLKDTKLF